MLSQVNNLQSFPITTTQSLHLSPPPHKNPPTHHYTYTPNTSNYLYEHPCTQTKKPYRYKSKIHFPRIYNLGQRKRLTYRYVCAATKNRSSSPQAAAIIMRETLTLPSAAYNTLYAGRARFDCILMRRKKKKERIQRRPELRKMEMQLAWRQLFGV